MKNKNQSALSLFELIIAMAMASILVLIAGFLLLGSNKAYSKVYASIHDPIQQDAKALTAAFGAVGRKSNRTNYTLYEVTGGSFVEAVPEVGESIATGQAVEFHYWDKPFYELSSDMSKMDIQDTGTHYALFYLKDQNLYVDYGEVVDGVGGVKNGTRQTNDAVTQCLAENVDINKSADIFSHEIIGGAGNGGGIFSGILENDKRETIEGEMATLFRGVWPQ
ncbi:MAG: prepilin-type N-terminal cleavage/methylation domain-containing protein [Deltaproteobacteria bacterium]|nr:prepilin-type N-terminal cleavage/methylation domain-containing protein [Deltaproteobacteria bacterium]